MPEVISSTPELDWTKVQPRMREIVVGTLAFFCWVLAFGLGLLIPTACMRSAIVATVEHHSLLPVTTAPSLAARSDLGSGELSAYILVSIVAFTLPNLFFLCSLSAFLGCMTRRWSTPFERYIEVPGSESRADGEKADSLDSQGGNSGFRERRPSIQDAFDHAQKDVKRAYSTAILRGFLGYLLFIAGYLIIVPENSLSELTPGQYARLAGAVSAFAFLVGYEPKSIGNMLSRVFAGDELGQDKGKSSKAKPTGGSNPPTAEPRVPA